MVEKEDKMLREVLVVGEDILFRDKKFEGFISINEFDFFSVINQNYQYKTRGPVETNASFKQVIPYVWLINPALKKVFLYKRAASGNENRLHNKYSGGVGGHIEKETEANSDNPIFDTMMRELKEEVVMNIYPKPEVIGFLCDSSDSVGQVHFGVVAVANSEEEVVPAEDMDSGEFYSAEEVDSLFSSSENVIEGWTRISWPFVKEYMAK